jgi:hypothetical protein
MKEIELTQGQVAIVDDWWFDYLSQWKWCARLSKSTQSYYAMRTEGKGLNRKTVLMHRVVAKTPDRMLCDHIHHKTLDNREEELRNVDNSQNSMNSKVQTRNKIGVKGIYTQEDCNGYRVIFQINGKRLLNKVYPTLDEAKMVRKAYEKIYFGEFALVQIDSKL